MPTKIRRCLYIGLGGTGINTILNTKKLFYDTYGNKPPMVGFLGVDTDGSSFGDHISLRNGQTIGLDNDEMCSIMVEDPFPKFDHNQEYLEWFPTENSRGLGTMTKGAGQIRSNGRFALWQDPEKFITKLKDKITDITNVENNDNPFYHLLSTAPTEIHMVFSICGGTGCGTFINAAYLIKQHFPTCNLYGYAVMPGVFLAQNAPQMPFVEGNAFGSLEDLDWLMLNDPTRDPFNIDNLNARYSTKIKPFNVFTLIDNENKNGACVDHVDKICQMISLALVASAGESSAGNSTNFDNMEKRAGGKLYDVQGKAAWASGMGICEVMIKGEDLAKIYAQKATLQLIDKLTASDGDTNMAATNWINKMQIREDQGQDQVIDYMFSKAPRQQMPEIANVSDAKNEVETWISKVTDDSVEVKDASNKLKTLSERITEELDKFVRENLQKSGLKFTENVIQGIKSQIEVCNKEMINEKADLESKSQVLQGKLTAAESTLAAYRHHWYSFGSDHTEEYKENVTTSAFNVAVSTREIKRRQYAIDFYSGLILQLESTIKTITDIENKLQNLHGGINMQLSELQQGINQNQQIFQIDLTRKYVNQITVEEKSDVMMSYFLGQTDMLSLATLNNQQELEQVFMNYTTTLKGVNRWKDITIDTVINSMSDKEKNNLVKDALFKSSPLLKYSYGHLGRNPQIKADEMLLVGVYDQAHPILTTEQLSKHLNKDSKAKPEFCSTGSKTSIIFYQLVGPIPPCALRDLAHYKEKAEKAVWNVHFDRIIQERMKDEGWSLFPMDDTSDIMELWVKGFIFEHIRNKSGKYQYQDFNESDRSVDDYWVSLGTDSRAMAYTVFKQKMANQKTHDAFAEKIQANILDMGQTKYQQLVQDVKAGQNYYNKYSQINLQRATLNSKGYGNIKKQITDEVDFVKKKL